MDEREEKLPRLSYELIQWLDESVPLPAVPLGQKGWANFDEAQARRMAWAAGQRHFVDVLIQWMNEEKRAAGDSYDEGIVDEPTKRFVRLLQEDGDLHSIPISRALVLDT